MKINHLVIIVVLSLIIFNTPVSAHCDGLDGPVVKAAIKSLDSENIDFVLIWIQEDYEDEVKAAFARTLSVRKLSNEAKELADRFFFETIVRIHREGEGAPYDGLKPAGIDYGPAITAADKVFDGASVEDLLKILTEALEKGVHSSYHEATEKKNFNTENIEAGREYVEAYVKFIHKVENIYNSTKFAAHKDNESLHEH